MTPEEIRLECLKLALPRDLANPDVELVMKRASAFVAFVLAAGTSSTAAPGIPVSFKGDTKRPDKR